MMAPGGQQGDGVVRVVDAIVYMTSLENTGNSEGILLVVTNHHCIASRIGSDLVGSVFRGEGVFEVVARQSFAVHYSREGTVPSDNIAYSGNDSDMIDRDGDLLDSVSDMIRSQSHMLLVIF